VHIGRSLFRNGNAGESGRGARGSRRGRWRIRVSRRGQIGIRQRRKRHVARGLARKRRWFRIRNVGVRQRGQFLRRDDPGKIRRRRDRFRRRGCPKARLLHRIGLRVWAVCIARPSNARQPTRFHRSQSGEPLPTSFSVQPKTGRRSMRGRVPPTPSVGRRGFRTLQRGAEPLVRRAKFRKMDYYPWRPCRSSANFDVAAVAYPGRANERDRLRGALRRAVRRKNREPPRLLRERRPDRRDEA
jgi:hypothetical protein